MFSEGEWSFVQNHILLPGVSLGLQTGVRVGQILPTHAPTPTPTKTVDADQLRNPGAHIEACLSHFLEMNETTCSTNTMLSFWQKYRKQT